MKAEWQKRDFKKYKYPPEKDYVLFEELTLSDGGVIARIEQFKMSDHCFYATTAYQRSGCLGSHEYARQWCEHQTGNKVN
jgi:hypothetical protein